MWSSALQPLICPRYRGLELNNMATNDNEKSTQTNENEDEGIPNLLVGYVRRSNAGGAI